MVKYKISQDVTSNGIPCGTFGSGSRKLLLFIGGPGGFVPQGFTFKFMMNQRFSLCKEYTITVLTRKKGMNQGYTTEDMARDYAEAIRQDFGGHVDAVIGSSFGGMIALHFGADYPELYDKIVFAAATNELTPAGKELDLEYARLLAAGKKGKATATIMAAMREPGIKLRFLKFFARIMVPFFKFPDYPEFKQDVLIEANAEVSHDASEKLDKIINPSLILIGDRDFYFTVSSAEKLHEAMPNSVLKVYKNVRHDIEQDTGASQDLDEFLIQ